MSVRLGCSKRTRKTNRAPRNLTSLHSCCSGTMVGLKAPKIPGGGGEGLEKRHQWATRHRQGGPAADKVVPG